MIDVFEFIRFYGLWTLMFTTILYFIARLTDRVIETQRSRVTLDEDKGEKPKRKRKRAPQRLQDIDQDAHLHRYQSVSEDMAELIARGYRLERSWSEDTAQIPSDDDDSDLIIPIMKDDTL